eukprot:TRINITY_DN1059_c0_g1_i1.p1 TRINITY_DN1059_c0_g1~~TRINITY_DN1059_c0_g1_i1.p1  ORF type:complete len:415 (+),score=98.47 TRINITY_DN1059_c0_g1_i1:84-1328(+)
MNSPKSGKFRTGKVGLLSAEATDDPNMEIQLDIDDTEDTSLINNANDGNLSTLFSRGRIPEEKLKGYPKAVAGFYKNQNLLLDAFSNLDNLSSTVKTDEELQGEDELAAKNAWKIKIGIYGSFATNIALFVLKLIAAISSGSIAVFASALDSCLDLLSGSIIFVTNHLIKRKNPYLYPAGKDRLEPLGIIVFSACMFTMTIQLLTTAAEKIATKSLDLKLTPFTIAIIGLTVVSKFLLYLYCRSVKGSISVATLAQDHRNDILSNGVGALASLLGFYVAWWIDPVGGILIGLFIMRNWFLTGYEQVKNMTGISANNLLLQQITYFCWRHDVRIKKIDTVRAFHFGLGFIVEVDIVLPPEMNLKEAHDIGQNLQDKLEQIHPVDRAFVHLDYETSHEPEHGPGRKIFELEDFEDD